MNRLNVRVASAWKTHGLVRPVVVFSVIVAAVVVSYLGLVFQNYWMSALGAVVAGIPVFRLTVGEGTELQKLTSFCAMLLFGGLTGVFVFEIVGKTIVFIRYIY